MTIEQPVIMEAVTTAHDLEYIFFKQPTPCYYCNELIGGLQKKSGYKCANKGHGDFSHFFFACHHRCLVRLSYHSSQEM